MGPKKIRKLDQTFVQKDEKRDGGKKRGRKPKVNEEQVSKKATQGTKSKTKAKRKTTTTKKKPGQQQKKQRLVSKLEHISSMWEADYIPKIKEQILEQEQNLPLNSFCTDFLHDEDGNARKTFVEKIHKMKNKLSVKSEKYRNSEDWIKELHEACKQEINQIKEILKRTYELKKYYKPILNKEERKFLDDQQLYTFGLNPELWIGSRNETAPPGCGSVRNSKNSIISEGQYVAAFVIPYQKYVEGKIDQADLLVADLEQDGSWILARCISPPKEEEKEFLIADIDDVDNDDITFEDFKILGKALSHFRVPRKALIPLPICIADPELNPEAIFPIGAEVLALYKETTSFFPAVVEDTPKHITDPYKLRFRDDNQKVQNQVYLVLQKYVIEYRDSNEIFSKEELMQLTLLRKFE